MEGEKRKREHRGEAKEKRLKHEEKKGVDGAEAAVSEEEVDEFFAIMRRIHVAVKYFEKSNEGKRWRPALFEKEDILEEVNADIDGVRKEDDDFVGEDSGLDLNSDPGSKESDV